MSAPKAQPNGSIEFLIATPKACSSTNAARVQTDQPDPSSQCVFTRLLARPALAPETRTWWLWSFSCADAK